MAANQDYKKALQELTTEVNKIKASTSEYSKSLIELQNTTKKVASTQADLTKKKKANKDVTTKLTTVDKELIKLDKQMAIAEAKLTNEYKQVALATLKKQEAVKKSTAALKEQAGITKKSSGLFKSMTKSILAAGAAMLTIRAAINVVRNSFKTIVEFESGMSKVRAITNATATAFSELKSSALTLGSTTSKTASEVAGLQLEFSKLGFSTKDILNATEATIQLSIAAGSDLAESAIVAASTVRGFGEATEQTGRIVDVMAMSFASSALDLNKFKTAMAVAAPVANSFGKDLEFTTAQLSVLSDAGIDASTSGTSLRNMFLELSKKGLTWDEGLQKINDSTNKNVTALDLFGKRGATAALILAENTVKAKDLETSYRNSAGAAKLMAEIMEDNLAGETKKLSSAWEGFVLSLNEGDSSMTKMLRGVVKFGTSLLNTITPTEKLSTSLIKQQGEFNVLVEALKEKNITSEEESKLITRLNTQYTEYLPNLITEKTTKEELNEIQKAANALFIEGITLKLNEEKVTEILAKKVHHQVRAYDLLVEIKKREVEVDKLQKAGLYDGVAAAQLSIQTLERKRIAHLASAEAIDKEAKAFLDAFAITTDASNEQTNTITNNSEQTIKSNEKLLDGYKKFAEGVAKESESALDDIYDKEKSYIDKLNDITSGVEDEAEAETDSDIQGVVDSLDKESKAKAEAAKEEEEEELAKQERIKKIKEDAYDAGAEIISDRYSAGLDESLAKFTDSEEAKQDALKVRLDNGEISEADYEKEISKSKLKIRQEEAKAEKKKALFDIAINTAVGIVKAIPKVPLMIAAAAAGAIQAAVVASRPIPKYEHGTNGQLRVATDAVVSESGQELLRQPGMPDVLTPVNESMIHLPKNAEILPNYHPETQAALAGGMSEEHYNGIVQSNLRVEKAVKGIKQAPYWTSRGLQRRDKLTGLRQNYISERIN